MPPTLKTLTVSVKARVGGQTVTVTEPVGSNSRLYKITDTSVKPEISYDTVVNKSDGWSELPINGEVSGTKNQVITIVDVDSKFKARAKGESVLPEPTTGD